MINIKVTTCAPDWPWYRQFPNNTPELGPFRFHIDNDIDECDIWFVFESLSKTESVRCPANRTVFITGEPDSIGRYSKSFLKQFHYVVSSRKNLKHPNILRMQQGHPWFVEKTFDELIDIPIPEKNKDLCILTSSKSFTEGHKARLRFLDLLKQRLGNRLDIYGRGINDFDSKWDILASYKYTIVLENFISEDFLTEKLPDAWLAFCVPFYAGCPNLNKYFKEGAWININLDTPSQTIDAIAKIIDNEEDYFTYLENIKAARRNYLFNYQFFSNLETLSKLLLSLESKRPTTISLSPQGTFNSNWFFL